MATELATHLSTVCCGRIMPDVDKAFQGHVRSFRQGRTTMQEHTCSTGCMIAIVAFLLLLSVGWT
ncbi:MAG: hypothetical protein ACRERE_22280, partial [Candidatus Entotheonellia bacterium]